MSCSLPIPADSPEKHPLQFKDREPHSPARLFLMSPGRSALRSPGREPQRVPPSPGRATFRGVEVLEGPPSPQKVRPYSARPLPSRAMQHLEDPSVLPARPPRPASARMQAQPMIAGGVGRGKTSQKGSSGRFPGPTLQDRMLVTFHDFTTPFNPAARGSWLDSADESDVVRSAYLAKSGDEARRILLQGQADRLESDNGRAVGKLENITIQAIGDRLVLDFAQPAALLQPSGYLAVPGYAATGDSEQPSLRAFRGFFPHDPPEE
eukprot:CAMPEP_0180190160 /NCGR_PEP_ID=MMETSP0987-20121128/731_1 /TAXON_ID=697907 /ORGANISM="non described non described, Strain CCMP2293" /LENGTH=264 /DNA_ID=CAMNT_0022144567 /DNA_START=145 /DNA_END=940 /DNA_ORIENTATION=+